MKKTETVMIDGCQVIREKNLKRRLNLNMLSLTNKTVCCGEMDFPELRCDVTMFPDFIALYDRPGEYHRTPLTCVSFYVFDDEMDGRRGLYNALKYNDRPRIEKFRERFRGVPYFIAPDYTVMGDVPAYHNYYRIGAAREIALWLTLENNSIVLPNLSAGSRRDFKYIFDGLEHVSVAGISTKSKLMDSEDRALLHDTILEAVNNMSCLKTIVVYDVTTDNKDADELFCEAREQGIEIIIPDNTLKIRNRIHSVRRDAK